MILRGAHTPRCEIYANCDDPSLKGSVMLLYLHCLGNFNFFRNAARESIFWLILLPGNGNVWMRPQICVLEVLNSFALTILFLRVSEITGFSQCPI